jgi:hypothetical protein
MQNKSSKAYIRGSKILMRTCGKILVIKPLIFIIYVVVCMNGLDKKGEGYTTCFLAYTHILLYRFRGTLQ